MYDLTDFTPTVEDRREQFRAMLEADLAELNEQELNEVVERCRELLCGEKRTTPVAEAADVAF